MSEPRFEQLERTLIRHGVAARHARRAALEMDAHYQHLRREALQRGATPEAAAQSAHVAIGADVTLIARYASQSELRGWLYRWPGSYVFAPLACFAMLCALIMIMQLFTVAGLLRVLHHSTVPSLVASVVNGVVVMILLWVLPLVISAAFAWLAGSRPVTRYQLIGGVLLVCLTARLMNVALMLPIPGHHASASMGIKLSLSALPGQLTCALISAALALVPYFLLTYRANTRTDQSVAEC